MSADDLRFDTLRQGWMRVSNYLSEAGPDCPCRMKAGPLLADWLHYEADWLIGEADASKLADQEFALRTAVAHINGDPLPMDPRMGAGPDAQAGTPDMSSILGILAPAAKALEEATKAPASAAGQAAGQSAVDAAKREVPNVVSAASDAVKKEVPGLVKQATDLVAATLKPMAEDLGRTAGKAAGDEAGKAAVKSAQAEAQAQAWSTGEKVVGGVLGFGILGGLLYGGYRLLSGGKKG